MTPQAEADQSTTRRHGTSAADSVASRTMSAPTHRPDRSRVPLSTTMTNRTNDLMPCDVERGHRTKSGAASRPAAGAGAGVDAGVRCRSRRPRTIERTVSGLVLVVVLVLHMAACSDGGATRAGEDPSESSDRTVAPGRRNSAPLGNVELPPLEFSAIDGSGTVQADITSEALFDFDSAELKPAVDTVLDQIGQQLGSADSWVRIEGFTDGKGDEQYNLDLSQRRADAFAEAVRSLQLAQDVQSCGRGEQGTDGESEDPSARRVLITIRAEPFDGECE